MKKYGISNLNSFFLALFIYIFIVFVVFFRLISMEAESVKYTDIKDSFIDIELSESSKKVLSNNAKSQETKTLQQVDIQKLFESTTNQAVKTEEIDQKATDFNELFGNVKDIQEEKTTKVQSNTRSESSSAVLKPQASELVKQLNDSLISEQEQVSGDSQEKQRTGIYDEFLGKVQRIIQERWRLYNPVQGKLSVVVKIFIDEEGKFGYTSLEKSYDEIFDAKAQEFLDNLKGKFIAYPPKNQVVYITMNLGDETMQMQQ